MSKTVMDNEHERIPFKHGEAFAMTDKHIFELWKQGRITAEEGCKRMAENNNLDYILIDVFIRTAIELGY